MALKDVIARRVLDEMLGKLCKEGQWKVLILDTLSTRIISACCKMSDVMARGITLVESLSKSRQPLPHLEAIYVVVPSEENIEAIKKDYSGTSPMYKAAHIFFLEKVPTTLFSKLGASKAAKKISTIKEANMAFLPYESNVFTLDYPSAFGDFYSPGSSASKKEMAERIADQVATVCAMLGEYPIVRYRNDVDHLVEIAEAVQSKLDAFKADKRDLGTGHDKAMSQLIILDRGFDVVSPILHELTYQAMAYDLLKVENDVYTYKAATVGGAQKSRDVILDENDDLWVQLRHAHIADVSREVAEKFKEFGEKKHLKKHGDKELLSIKDLSRYIKNVPQYQKELSVYSLHLNMVDTLLSRYRQGGDSSVSKVAKVEQNLATGTDAAGDPITDPMADMMPLLFSKDLSYQRKARLLVLYILFKKGVSRDDFSKLMQHSELPLNERKVILNLMHLGHKILAEEKVSVPKHRIKPKERPGEKYEVSRWSPLLQDIAEYAAEGKLDESYAPCFRGKAPRPTSGANFGGGSVSGTSVGGASGAVPGTSVRQRWNWIPGQKQEGASPSKGGATASAPVKRGGPTIIIFVVGGMTYSEMRAAYEASAATNCEVIIGSTHIVTPTRFMDQLKSLQPLVAT